MHIYIFIKFVSNVRVSCQEQELFVNFW